MSVTSINSAEDKHTVYRTASHKEKSINNKINCVASPIIEQNATSQPHKKRREKYHSSSADLTFNKDYAKDLQLKLDLLKEKRPHRKSEEKLKKRLSGTPSTHQKIHPAGIFSS